MTGTGIYCHRCGDRVSCPQCGAIVRHLLETDGLQYRAWECNGCGYHYSHDCNLNHRVEEYL